MASGAPQIIIHGYNDVMREISTMRGLRGKAEKAVSRTIADFKSRGPGWVSQEVVKEYNIKKKEINGTLKSKNSAGTIRVQGTSVDNVTLRYEGRVLTPTHFAMRPGTRPKKKAYTVTAQIKKSGGRKPLSSKAFLAHSGAEGTKQIPFMRTGAERLPIVSIKTLSVPQMITNEEVSKAINKRINKELGKRLEHNLKRMVKR